MTSSSSTATVKTLYMDDDMFIDIECSSNFADDGHCAQDDMSFYVNTREHDASEHLLERARDEIHKRTHDCFDVSRLHHAEHTGERSRRW